MPATNTIASSDFTTFSPLTGIQSAKMNTNFSIWRGHLLPVDPTTSAAVNGSYNLGSSTYKWGTIYANALSAPITHSAVSTTGSYSVTTADEFVVFANTGATVTATLPAVAGVSNGAVITIKRTVTSTYTVLIDGSGSETIDNTTVVSLLNPGDSYSLLKLGSEWHIV